MFWRRILLTQILQILKAKDVDFKKVLNAATTASLRATHTEHFEREGQIKENGEYFTVPFNPSMDGNTVEISVEQAKYGKVTQENIKLV